MRKRTFATSGPRATDTISCNVRGRSFTESWFWRFDRGCTFMCKASNSTRISGCGMSLPNFSTGGSGKCENSNLRYPRWTAGRR